MAEEAIGAHLKGEDRGDEANFNCKLQRWLMQGICKQKEMGLISR